MKKIVSTALIFVAVVGIRTGTVHAEDAVDVCALTTSDFTALQAVQSDPTLTPDQELSQELALRKQLLGKVIACAVKQAQTLETTLTATKPATPNAIAVQNNLLGRVNDAINLYNLESAKLNDAGINSS